MENQLQTSQEILMNKNAENETPSTSKYSKAIFFACLIALLIGIVAVRAYFWSSNSTKLVPPTYVAPPSPTITQPIAIPTKSEQSLKSYSDDQLSFQYPTDFSAITAEQPYYFLSTPIIALSSNKSELIAPNYTQINIVVVSSTADTKNCLSSPQENATLVGKKEIRGNEFTVYSVQDAGAGNHYDTTIYRTIQNQKCYEIAQTIHSSSDWNGIDIKTSDASISKAKEVLDQILLSVHFIQQ